ncbi:YihY/virulence factor BrkB family protein [Mycoplasma enhydrae]|uniref:YihY/virulence factor BrkB family protein n=1 Tax=Mycoplasma enhydrae TaxID=2499220 RepID=UPI00197B1213|nr:YihY/virulence factor BrkB family protein [Mycoplasma enhydrae]MBN4089440.1 YihY/virulence factor BrkB family protein [Mycoplasma enhydrae]MCV3733496.1 YihY/virulence factor BrkB family protein [Mycoplasma enhydrae]
MRRKKKDTLQTGWGSSNDDNDQNKKENYHSLSSKQIVKNKNKQNIFEKVLKWIIYGILFIAIPNYLKGSKTKGKEIVNSAYSKINSNEFAFVPAGYAMYLFLSFIPTLGLVVGIAGAINPELEVIIKVVILGQLIPGIKEVIPTFSSVWTSAGGVTAFILLTLSILWLGSKGYAKFIFSFDALYEHKSPNLIWKTRIKGFVTSVFITCVLTVLLLSTSSFLNFILDKGFGQQAITGAKEIELSDLRWEFQLIFWLPTVIFLPFITYVAFLLFFKFEPNFKLKFAHVNPGSLIAAIPTSFYILIFGSLTSLIDYKKFGVVASFMYIILLLSVMAYFIYSGVIVNSSFYKTFINLPTIEKTSIFRRNRKI